MSEAREIAEHQLETAIKDFLIDELEACWSRFKDETAITDPEAEMAELAEWFDEQVQAAIEEVIEQDPVDDEESDGLDDDEDDDEEEEDDDEE